MMARLVKVLAMVAGLVPGAAVGVAVGADGDAPLRWMPAYVEVLEAGDCVAALTILDKAEARGDLRAVFADGRLYEKGQCVKRDVQRAVALYEAAAPHYAEAGIRLWAVHEYGLVGGVSDPDMARRWAGMAARRLVFRSRAGARAAFEVHGGLQRPGVIVDRALDAVYDVKTAGPKAMFREALRFKDGDGRPKDPQAACYWLSLVAEQGVGEASLELARMLFFGEGVSPQPFYAAFALTDAMRADVAQAYFLAAELWLDASLVFPDKVNAYLAMLKAEGLGADVSTLKAKLMPRLTELDIEVAMERKADPDFELHIISRYRWPPQPRCSIFR